MRPTPSPERLAQLAAVLHRLARTQRNLPLLATEQEHTDLREAGYALASLSADLASLKAELDEEKAWSDTLSRGTGLCGHWSAHSIITDAEGKGITIDCLDCQVARLSAELVALKAERAKAQALVTEWRSSADWMMGSTNPDEWQRGGSGYLRNCADELEAALLPPPPASSERGKAP